MSYPEGRSDDLIELASGQIVHPQAIRSLFNEERSIWEYQVEQLADTRFRVALLDAPACDRDAVAQRVVDNLSRVVGNGACVEVEFVDAIDRTLGGKTAPVISRRDGPGRASAQPQRRATMSISIRASRAKPLTPMQVRAGRRPSGK